MERRQPFLDRTNFPAAGVYRLNFLWRSTNRLSATSPRRLSGDIIDYDTSVQQIARWIEKTYVRYDFNGFTGDRKFIHDIDAQKSFAKLRSAIAGFYLWRFSPRCPPEYRRI
jgi:surfactin synthase thioesterase subunit